MTKPKFPGCTNVAIDEALVFARIGKENGESMEETLELIECIDGMLSIQKSAAIINKPRGNTVRRKTMKDVLVGRLMQANIFNNNK